MLGADCYLFATPESLAAIVGLIKGLFGGANCAALGRTEVRP